MSNQIEKQSGTDLATIGQIANGFAARAVFEDYRMTKADNTTRRHDNDLSVFADYLSETGLNVSGDELTSDCHAWDGMTWGTLEGFKRWMLKQGYAINSINQKLSSVKIYAGLAHKAGCIGVEESMLIRSVKGFTQTEGKRVDSKREETRISTKKSEAILITDEQADYLKNLGEGPQGARDALMMCLLIDHGLRVSEVELLEVDSIDLDSEELRFYRPKTDEWTRHKLTRETLKRARYWLENHAPESGPLLVGSRKNGNLVYDWRMSSRAINKRVGSLGSECGIDGLSPHDLRHYAATRLAKTKGMAELMSIFGWTSPATAMRYIEAPEVADPE